MAPYRTFDAGTWNGTACTVDIISNSTVSDVQVGSFQHTISFNVTGVEETTGFWRVTIPNTIVRELWQGNYSPSKRWAMAIQKLDRRNKHIHIRQLYSLRARNNNNPRVAITFRFATADDCSITSRHALQEKAWQASTQPLTAHVLLRAEVKLCPTNQSR